MAKIPVGVAAAIAVGLRGASAPVSTPGPMAVTVTPGSTPRVATVDERYEPHNVQIAEVIGGNFCKPSDRVGGASATPSSPTRDASFELTNARLRKLQPRLVMPMSGYTKE